MTDSGSAVKPVVMLAAVALIALLYSCGTSNRPAEAQGGPAGSDLHVLQPPGDPPVTVGDGSLHVHSSKGWVPDTTPKPTTIKPKSLSGNSTGTLAAGCGLTDPSDATKVVPALLWTDEDKIQAIPMFNGTDLKVVVAHKNGSNVTISFNAGSLQISTDNGYYFEDVKGGDDDDNNRAHSHPSKVTSITAYTDPTTTTTLWTPDYTKSKYRHYTLEFCYH